MENNLDRYMNPKKEPLKPSSPLFQGQIITLTNGHQVLVCQCGFMESFWRFDAQQYPKSKKTKYSCWHCGEKNIAYYDWSLDAYFLLK